MSEFISFITSEASDRCQQEKRKTINGDDLLWAMQTLGFDDYGSPLKIYLQVSMLSLLPSSCPLFSLSPLASLRALRDLQKYRQAAKGDKPGEAASPYGDASMSTNWAAMASEPVRDRVPGS